MTNSWRETLVRYNENLVPRLFDQAFLDAWGTLPWEPSEADRKAAAMLYTQLISRISLQPLSYSEGTEKAALASIFQLFQKTRDAVDANYKCALFESVAWHVVNEHVRPFTAKWHRRSEANELEALDTSDEFRLELATLRPRLAAFADLLIEIRDGEPARVRWRDHAGNRAHREPIVEEIRQELRFGLVSGEDRGAASEGAKMPSLSTDEISQRETEQVQRRRAYYACLSGRTPVKRGFDAVGLALSGGGIRSATFSLGVLMALAARNILPQIDYLSTVSGGSYLGAFLMTFLSAPAGTGSGGAPMPEVGLRRDQLPFRRSLGEPDALRHLRHNSRYLQTGSIWGRVQAAFAQVYGVFLNLCTLAVAVAPVAAADKLLNSVVPDQVWLGATVACVVLLIVAAALLPFGIAYSDKVRRRADSLIALVALVLLALLLVAVLHQLHELIETRNAERVGGWVIAGLVVLVLLLVAAGRLLEATGLAWIALSAITTVLLLLTTEVVFYALLDSDWWWAVALGTLLAATVTYCGIDINFSSLHRHYRGRLAAAFLMRRSEDGAIEPVVPEKLSQVLTTDSLPYPLVNAALNVPATKNPAMQGRLTDFFLFSPFCCGSRLTRYYETPHWETADPNLDIATAMAISGAAASPQMGLHTSAVLRFWMALFNVRLGYWLPRPGAAAPRASGAHLLREMFGRMDEMGSRLFVSDGGHIENLGVYELLRRRCKFILAVDGEQDPRMTFHAITNLQRLAYIDMGIEIDIDLNDLRLGPTGLSRSHFILSRIDYPSPGGRERPERETGYLLYMKLSLTGNESEYLRRYKLDEPDFPHHSTADQFFTEPQFEAYRALGEHVGDKLFLGAIVGKIASQRDVRVPSWFEELAASLLQPRRA